MTRGARTILTTLLFTDIVGSTSVAEEMGDRRWRELLARHHQLIRQALKRHGGREIDTAGDGFFARFDAPAAAIRCGSAVRDAVRELGVEIRVGVHIGECEILDGKVSGVNVHVGARTMAQAGAGDVYVTGGVRDLVKGGGFGFADLGMHELRGVEGEWHLFQVTSIDDVPDGPIPSEQERRARRDKIEPPPLVRRRWVRLTAGTVGIAAAVAGAGVVGIRTLLPQPKEAITGCMVTAFPPLNDHSFNQAVFDGLTDAATTWSIGVRDRISTAFEPKIWAKHIRELVSQRCSLIVSVGTDMADVTVAAAKGDTTEKFVVTDSLTALPKLPNLLSVQFRADQAAFEAGYLAAGMTKTGKVATFGGIPISTVTQYMDGFTAGVFYYNRANRAHVQVLGWDPKRLVGSFVSDDQTNFGAFDDLASARRLSTAFISSGADIIMPVDGTTGNKAAGQAAQRAQGVLLIGVDADQHFSTPQYDALWLTSALKNYRVMVYDAMGMVVHHHFRGGLLVATVSNRGVGLAPFYQFAKVVPATLTTKLKELEAGIANGSISVDPASYSSG